MAKYAVNEEGVEAMNTMANAITEAIEKARSLATNVQSVANSNADTLGPHKGSLDTALEEINESLRQASEPASCISEILKEVAEAYEEILGNDRVGGIGKENATAAVSNATRNSPAAGGVKPYSDGGSSSTPGNSLFGIASAFSPLEKTNQGKGTIKDSAGRQATVFDHPFSDNNRHIFSQGSAFPADGKGGGIEGTCGLCACGTIINKAGGQATEKTVAKHALQNGLCSNRADEAPEHRGGTSIRQQAQILSDAGLQASASSGCSLEGLSQIVETGRGVIISVTASIYKPEWYGPYSEENSGGHAIVLESPIRDVQTGHIVGYVVSDSNGSTGKEATVVVKSETLETAFDNRGGLAVITDDIIW